MDEVVTNTLKFFTTECEKGFKVGNLFNYESENENLVYFLKGKHYEKIVPEIWRKCLSKCTTEQLLMMVLEGEIPKNEEKEEIFSESLRDYVRMCVKLRENFEKILKEEFQSNFPEYKKEKIEGILNIGMSGKKKYEVEKLCYLIKQLVEKNNIDLVINIGCGKGYLSQILSFKYGLEVIGIDCNKNVLIKAKEKFEKMESILKQKSKYSQVNTHIDKDIDEKHFFKLLEPILGNKELKNICLIGLHTCGNLGISILDLFLKSDKFKLCINIPCCFHKLREGDFPLSKFVKEKNFRISSAGYQLSAQSIFKWRKDNISDEGKVHCQGANYHCKRNSYRCGLECVLHKFVEKTDKNPFVIGKIPKKYCRTFGGYAIFALEKVRREKRKFYKLKKEAVDKLKNKDSFMKELDKFYDSFLPNDKGVIKEVEIFWILRSILSSCLENLILSDRVRYIKEKKVVAKLFSVFDKKISPRNMMIVLQKK